MTYDEIHQACMNTKQLAQAAGYDTSRCVWEFTQVVVDTLAPRGGKLPFKTTLLYCEGLPVRIVPPDSPPITIKLVCPEPFQ